MSTFWRISNHPDLEGNGGRHFASRWSSQGLRIVFLAESPAGAMLEILVHLPFAKGRLPDHYNLMQVEVSEGCSRRNLNPPRGKTWKDHPETTRRIGDSWLRSRETALARVPSVILPHTWNWVLNPEHEDAAKAAIVSITRERFDNRLFRFGAR